MTPQVLVAVNSTAGLQEDPTVHYGVFAVLLLLGLAIIFISSAFIAQQWRHRHKKEAISLYLISWVVGDLLGGLLLCIYVTVSLIKGKECPDLYYCYLRESVGILLICIPALHLLILSVERWMAVIYSVLHEIHYTRKKMIVHLCACWFVILLVSSTIFVVRKEYFSLYTTIFMLIFYVAGSLVALIIYIKLLYITSEHERNIHVTTTLTYENFLQEVWIAKLYCAKTAIFTLLWLPYIVTNALTHFSVVPENLEEMSFWFYAVGLLSTVSHTIIWILSHRNLKAACRQWLACRDY